MAVRQTRCSLFASERYRLAATAVAVRKHVISHI